MTTGAVANKRIPAPTVATPNSTSIAAHQRSKSPAVSQRIPAARVAVTSDSPSTSVPNQRGGTVKA
ncbi:MAG TPA: hypothetical protein VIX84_19495 [Acidimicrobiales bacterium]